MKTAAVRVMLLGTILAAGTLLACASGGPALSEEEISLRREGLLELTAPPPTEYALLEPGESKLLARAAFGAPPMIPHSIADVELSASGNDCLDCHEVSDNDTPGVPASHRVKAMFSLRPRNRAVHGSLTVFDGFVQTAPVTGQRYNCLLCHAPQATNATSVVEIAIPFVKPADPAPDKLEGLKESEGPY